MFPEVFVLYFLKGNKFLTSKTTQIENKLTAEQLYVNRVADA
jgi:hypothetical protein